MIEAAIVIGGLVSIIGGGIWAANLPEEEKVKVADECARQGSAWSEMDPIGKVVLGALLAIISVLIIVPFIHAAKEMFK